MADLNKDLSEDLKIEAQKMKYKENEPFINNKLEEIAESKGGFSKKE